MRPLSPTRIKAAVTHRARRLGRHLQRATDPLLDLRDPERLRYQPPEPAAHEDYRAHFVDSARAFDRFLRRARDIRCENGSTHIAVVVMPWFRTPSPWYAIALGLGLASRGRSVTFIWHDLPFTGSSADFREQNEEIGRALHALRRRFPVLRVSTFPPSRRRDADDDRVVDDLVAQNLTWATRASPALDAGEQHLANEMRRSLVDALPRVRSLLCTTHFDVVVAPGGVLAASGLYLHCATDEGERAGTFDTGLGWTVVCTDGVAAQQTDLARAFAMLPDEPGGRGQAVLDAARDEFERRRHGTDATSYQSTSTSPRTSPRGASREILVPLSVMFDTAALGRHHLFADSAEWLVATVATVLRATDDPVIIRQHPAERRPLERSRFDAGAILADAFGVDPRVCFVPAEDPVNTYDLLDRARLVLPFVSTIGIEAAALGKPVVLGGAVYYSDLGFVWSAADREQYVDLVTRGARDELPELPDQHDAAWRCYYLNAVCQRVWTDFTCQPVDYWRWVGRDPAELFVEPEIDDLLTALEDGVPVPIMRHRRLMGLTPRTPPGRPSRTG